MILQGDLWKDTRGRVSNSGEVYAMGAAAQAKCGVVTARVRSAFAAWAQDDVAATAQRILIAEARGYLLDLLTGGKERFHVIFQVLADLIVGNLFLGFPGTTHYLINLCGGKRCSAG
ncbi:MAG: hypothetical protein U5Q16_08100 [Gammaproteobacteria bacterium]|nr:hypothetical protein [Gammaproteobacteria bacterium]